MLIGYALGRPESVLSNFLTHSRQTASGYAVEARLDAVRFARVDTEADLYSVQSPYT